MPSGGSAKAILGISNLLRAYVAEGYRRQRAEFEHDVKCVVIGQWRRI